MSNIERPIVDLALPLEDAESDRVRREQVARQLGVTPERVVELRLVKRSIDARQRQIKVQLRFEVGLDENLPELIQPAADYPAIGPEAEVVVIVGCGPAGLFAGLRCLELGLRPVILERGKDASRRRFDLAPLLRHGKVVEDSNYCFGEGGAGTFSDGKLYTRAKKRGPVAEIYRTLVAHGAPDDILVDAHPHIGSNLLPKVVMSMRQSLLAAGGEVHFETKVTDLICRDQRVVGVRAKDGREFTGKGVVLATGHSARDVYRMLLREHVTLESKAFAVGVRIEHPQHQIDQLQYHLPVGDPRPAALPAASYQLSATVRERGVHSFCMCPGGFIVPAATENDEVVVNGMSLSKRDSPFANSGMVVGVELEDLKAHGLAPGPLSGIEFQRELETAAKRAGGGGQVAPGQRAVDFVQGALSDSLPDTSYRPGVVSARLDQILPDWMAFRLKKGLSWFGRQREGYLSPDALVVGFETRTSSPVRIPRDPTSLQHREFAGLYPCGEGAGYAGGIVSAALDGWRVAEALANVS